MNKIDLFKTRIIIGDKVYLLAKDVRVDLMCCDAPGISFCISQAEVIKILNPNMYRDVVLIDGDIDFAYSKTITKDVYTE